MELRSSDVENPQIKARIQVFIENITDPRRIQCILDLPSRQQNIPGVVQ